MIEFKVSNHESGGFDGYLVVDGVERKDGYVTSYHRTEDGSAGTIELMILDEDLQNTFASRPISDWPTRVKTIYLKVTLSLIEDETTISQSISLHRYDATQVYIAFTFLYSVENWKRQWSITEYQEEFKRTFEQQNLAGPRWSTEEVKWASVLNRPPGITLSFPVQDTNATVEAEGRSHANAITQLHRQTEASLTAKLRQESVVMQFDFPEEVKVPCEQYLLYFVQFLKDLGVEATAELQHEAGQVLFAVTPTDKETALDKIRDALEIYLRMSASPVSDGSALSSEIAVQRLTGEIQALQSRLTLARAEIQYKDKAIDAMQFIIDRQRLSGDVMVESLKNVTPKSPDKDKEAVLGGIVEITKYEGKGINVNFAEVFRRLKEYLAKRRKGPG